MRYASFLYIENWVPFSVLPQPATVRSQPVKFLAFNVSLRGKQIGWIKSTSINYKDMNTF